MSSEVALKVKCDLTEQMHRSTDRYQQVTLLINMSFAMNNKSSNLYISSVFINVTSGDCVVYEG